MKRPIGDGVQALRHHRPVDGRIPALNDSGGPVVGRGDNREALGGKSRAQTLATDDEYGRALGEPLAQQCGGVHGGREDLVRRGPNIVTGQLVDNGLRRAGSVVGDE